MQDTSSSLLFIPDISGFTAFVQQTEITHSQYIIAELLEVIGKANDLGLQLAEIEGDALFFYKHLDIPPIEALWQQARKMFIAFHTHLQHYDTRRICDCAACSTAVNLSLKIVAHAGTIGFVEALGRQKPHGEDVIIVHRLLKNDIHQREYFLWSDALVHTAPEHIDRLQDQHVQVLTGCSTYPHIGTVHYHYMSLTPLLQEIRLTPRTPAYLTIPNPVTFSGIIRQSAELIYQRLLDLSIREDINLHVKDVTFEAHEVNRVGTKHACYVHGAVLSIETVKGQRSKDTLVLVEKIENMPLLQTATLVYTLEKAPNQTSMTIEAHFTPKALAKPFARVVRAMMRQHIKTLFMGLKHLCEQAA